MKTFRFGAAALVAASIFIASDADAQFPRRGVRLLGNVPLSSFSGAPLTGSAVITYSSPSGREYAIMGATNGKHFFDITDPTAPVSVGFVSTPSNSDWQEMATVGPYCFGVSEHSATKVIDMTQIDSGIVSLTGTWFHSWFDPITSTTITLRDRAHTAQASLQRNIVYLNGCRDFSSPAKYYMVALDVTNPAVPTVAGYWSMFDAASLNASKIVYVHDITVHSYATGPYAGKELIFANCGYDGLYILDASNPAAISLIAKNTYLPSNTYAHSGSLSPDGKYYFLNDEFDEAYGGASNQTHVFDVRFLSDAAHPSLVYIGADSHGNNFIDHNSVVQDNRLLVSSYTGGLRIFKWNTATDLGESGYFDTHPSTNIKDYSSDWGVDARLPSGNVVLSDREYSVADPYSGLFIVDITEAAGLGAPPLSQVFTRGFVGGGTLNSSRRSDNAYLVYQGLQLGLDVTTTLETSNTTSGPGSFSMEASSANSPTSVTVYAKNWLTTNWVTLGKWNLGAADQTYSVAIADVAPYINGSNQIELRFKTPKKARGATGNPGVKFDTMNFSVP